MSRRLAIAATILAGLAAWIGASPAAGGARLIRPDQSSVLVFGGSPGAAVSLTEIPVRVRGDLVVQFHGDQATGCAARGLCGFSGTVIWQPPSTATLDTTTFRAHGRTEYDASLDLPGLGSLSPRPIPGGITTADVRFAPNGSGGSSSLCTDATPAGNEISLPVHLRAASVSLAAAMPSLLATRCAGPLQSDVARLLARRILDVAALSNGRTSVSLASSGEFAVHGLAGTVTSTIELSLGRPRTQRLGNGSSSSNLPRFRTVEVAYRAHLNGTATIRAHGDRSSCAPLGACGANSRFVLHMHHTPGELSLVAFTRARRPLRDALTALGQRKDGNPRGITVFGVFSTRGATTSAVDFSEGSATCKDTGPGGPVGIDLIGTGGRLSAMFGPVVPTHLRCPGPIATQDQGLASGTTHSAALARDGGKIHLESGVKLRDDGYVGDTVANLTLTVSRPKVKVRVDDLPAPNRG